MRVIGLVAALVIALLVGLLRYRHVSQLSFDAALYDLGVWSLGTFLGFALWFWGITLWFSPKGAAERPRRKKTPPKELDGIEGEIKREHPVVNEGLLGGMDPEQVAELVRRVNKE